MEECYNQEVEKASARQSKAPKEKPGTTPSPAPRASGQKTMGRGEAIKLHLKKMATGQDRTHVPPQDKGPVVGKHYEQPRCQEGAVASQASHPPLTDELLAPGVDVTTVLDYHDDVQEDPEITQAITDIPLRTDSADVEMRDVNAPPTLSYAQP